MFSATDELGENELSNIRSFATVGLGVVAVAVAVLGAPVAANADTSPAYYGYAACASSGTVPGSQALNTGLAKHQIGYGVAESYGERLIDMGSNPGYSRYRFENSYAAWATISTPGGQRLLSTSWACRSSGWH